MKQVDIDSQLKSILNEKSDYSLFFRSQQDQDDWFRMIQEHEAYQPLLQEVKEEAARLLDEPMDELSYALFTLFAKTGERLPYEKVYFAKRRRLNTFTFMSLLEPKNNLYREQLHEVI